MFGSAILDVALGLVFVFLLLSLICSAANELIEMVLKRRSKDLEEGISELIGDPNNETKFINAIYNHGLVNGLFRGDYGTTDKSKLPSYIPARNFALAIIDVQSALASSVSTGNAASSSSSATSNPTTIPPISSLIPKNVKTAFATLQKTAGTDAEKLQESVEDWYNSAMDRVSGWYKRRTQIFIFSLGFAIAIAVNVDCIRIAKRLSSDPNLRQGVVALAEATAKNSQPTPDQTKPIDQIKQNVKALDSLGLPIGWSEVDQGFGPWMQRILGWLLTALAVSLGAPFWFDMLNKIIVVRSTVKPHEKSKEEGSKDAKRSSDVKAP